MNNITAEDLIILALVVLGLAGGVVATLVAKPVVAAVLLALGISAAIFRFLGGTDEASVVTGTLRLGGTAAVFMIIAWFVNDNLTAQTTIDPPIGTWTALDHQHGAPVPVSVNGLPLMDQPSLDALADKVWKPTFDSRGIQLTSAGNDDFKLGYVDINDLQAFELFNRIDDPDVFRFTDALAAGETDVDLRPYPVSLSVGSFQDGLTDFVLRHDTGAAYEASLRNKTGKIFSMDGSHYLVVVASADHTGADKWVRFGFVELTMSLDPPATGEATSLPEIAEVPEG